MRVVASLTTMPDRYERLEKTLKTIYNQTFPLDAIYLSLPKVSSRLKTPYPPLPDSIKKLCTVVTCEDYGPITKIVGGIMAESDPNTVIITFDDDMIYPDTMVEELLKKHLLFPDMAIGSSGMLLKYSCPMCAITPNQTDLIFSIPKFPVPPEGRKVDSVYGYPGALYIRKFFTNVEDLTYYSSLTPELFINDDITISGYLSLRGIERRIFSGMPNVGFVKDENGTIIRTGNEISYDLDNFFKRLNTSIAKAKELGMYADVEEVSNGETILGISLSIIAICIAFGLGTWWIWKNGLRLPFMDQNQEE